MTVGGWLGGTLVYRNQIGVDHRYAEAGKWREVSVEGKPGEAVVVEGAQELQAGQMMLVRAGDRRIVVARSDDGFVAFDDHCTHRGGSLAGGTLACGTVCCPWHGSQFTVKDGSVAAGPAKKPIATYEVKKTGKEVQLVLPT
jgi:nitrite reductase/ring-hydroxylating ferredoxin subunit